MNFYKTLIFITILNLFTPCIVWASITYDDFRKELMIRLDNIKQNGGIINKETIFSHKVIDDTWYLQRNQALYDAGESLIIFLREYDKIYQQLEFSEWVKATHDLFLVDDSLGEQVGWGNLVIKITICNKIINRVLGYLDAQEELSTEELGSMLKVLENLRWHLPSEKSMYFILLRYYNLDTSSKVDSLNYKNIDSPENRPTTMRSEMSKIYYKNSKVKEVLDSQEKSEAIISQAVGDYQKLYHNPVPFYLAATARYHKVLWNLYFHIYLMKNSEDSKVHWEIITEENILQILNKVYQARNDFWVDEFYKDFFNNRENKEVRISLMKRFREDRVVKTLLINYANRLKHKAVTVINSNGNKSNLHSVRFRVHNLP